MRKCSIWYKVHSGLDINIVSAISLAYKDQRNDIRSLRIQLAYFRTCGSKNIKTDSDFLLNQLVTCIAFINMNTITSTLFTAKFYSYIVLKVQMALTFKGSATTMKDLKLVHASLLFCLIKIIEQCLKMLRLQGLISYTISLF